MYSQANTYSNSAPVNQYLMKEVMDASPQELLLKVYDFAIVNCQKQDIGRTNKAIQELINALRFDERDGVREVSIGLLKLYQYCQEQMRKGNHEIVQRILSELREQWKLVFSSK